MKSLTIAILNLIILNSTIICGQNNKETMKEKTEIGIEIFEKDFNYKLNKYIKVMDTNGSLNTIDLIVIVRIYNTLIERNLKDEKGIYQKFSRLFSAKYIEIAANNLEATVTKGMCYYSKKYDLYIGGKPHQNSMYIIIKP